MAPVSGRGARQEHVAYGEQIVSTLSRQLSADYGSGFSHHNLLYMIRFVEARPDQAEAAELAQNMGWSHFKEVLLINPLQGNFHAQMFGVEPSGRSTGVARIFSDYS